MDICHASLETYAISLREITNLPTNHIRFALFFHWSWQLFRTHMLVARTQKKAKFLPFPRSINCISIIWMDYDTLTWWYNVLIWVTFNGWLIWTLSYEDFVMKVLSLAIHNITRDACNGWRLESTCDALVMCTIRMCGLIVGTLNCTNKQFWLLDHIGNRLIHLTIANHKDF